MLFYISRILSIYAVIVGVTLSPDLWFLIASFPYLTAHALKASCVAFCLTSDIHLRQAVDSISLEHTLDQLQFFFCMSVWVVLRLSGPQRKAPNVSIVLFKLSVDKLAVCMVAPHGLCYTMF